MAFELNIHGNVLVCVPSVHFHVVFAQRVNQICRDPKTRPDAIAVELGPKTAGEGAIWLNELKDVHPFPVMMSLLKENNRISCVYKDLVIRMQKSEGKDLSEFSPEDLKNYFNYSAKSIFPFSPSDSMVEAMRCGTELGIPIYGVDLEDLADKQRKSENPRFEDYSNKFGDVLDEYIIRNAGMADSLRDIDIDYPREFSMAARLRYILEKHKRVLFICGIAHWKSISELLMNGKIAPAPVPEASGFQHDHDTFTRCILNPRIAAFNYMDVFPAYAGLYNEKRLPATNDSGYSFNEDSGLLLEKIMDDVKNNYFSHTAMENNENKTSDIFSFPAFKDYLNNLCLLRLKLLPDLVTLIDACVAIMSPDFTKALSDEFMKFNWASRQSHGELPMITPVPLQNNKQYMKARLLFPNYHRSEAFYMTTSFDRDGIVNNNIPWEENETNGYPEDDDNENEPQGGNGKVKGKTDKKGSNGYLRTWPPIDYLISALSLEARVIAKKSNLQSIEFQGSMMDGFDIKSTIRSTARGEDKIFVKEMFNNKNGDFKREYELDPVVWIFSSSEDKKSNWDIYSGPKENIIDFVSEPDVLREQFLNGSFFAALTYSSIHYFDQTVKNKNILYEYHHKGLLYFIPPFFTPDQDAMFVEKYNYKRVPIIKSHKPISDSEEIRKFFEEFKVNYGIDLTTTNWPVSMVRIAIKYALHEVTVIVPDTYVFDRIIFEDARISGKKLNIAPLNYFSKEHINKISKNYAVRTLPGTDGKKFPVSSEIYLNEKQDTYRDLIPKWFLNWKM